MRRTLNRLFLGGLVCAWTLCTHAALLAAQPNESLLPATAKGAVSIRNLKNLEENFNKTQLGKLMQDPIMQPFAEDFRNQLSRKWSQSHQKLGLSWQDLQDVPTGEVTVAAIQPGKNEAAFAVVMDCTGNAAKAAGLIEKIAGALTTQQAKRTTRELHGATITILDQPKNEHHPAQQSCFVVKNEIFLGADNLKVLETMLARVGHESSDSLASVKAFAATMKRCQTAAGETAPDIRWFIEPFGYAEISRTTHADRPKKKGNDMLKILKNQGFTAIQGIGGYVNFAVDNYEIIHRTFVYAPAVKEGAPEKYELAARMLDFPNGGDFQPQSWVPREVATYASFNLNIKKAFESSKTLVDEIVGDEVFDDVLTSILEDPQGPQIDIRRDLIGYLGTRATMLSDYVLPITPKSERMLVAIEATNTKVLAATIEKAMKADPDARRREFNGHVIWEVVDEAAALPMVTIENTPSLGPAVPGDKDDEEKEEHHIPTNSCITVAYDHLFYSTHIDLLQKVLTETSENDKLINSTDFTLIKAELDKLIAGDKCAQAFARTDEEYRAVYELIRTGRMPEAETMLGKLLNSLLGEGKEGVPRNQRIDGSKMPDFEAVRRYFGPAGGTFTSEADGWFVTGVFLTKDPQ